MDRAIEIVERALERYGAPVYVRHEIVHNKHVVDALRRKGAVFVDELHEVPAGAQTIFSAHGVSRTVEREAEARSLDVIDATCPLVAKVHREGQRYAERGYAIVLIGHRGHPEVAGTVGQIEAPVHIVGSVDEAETLVADAADRIAYITQTTLSVHDTRDIIAVLRRRFPAIEGPDTRDICYATQNRQNAVLDLAGIADTLVVVGSSNSSNSNRLREIGESAGIRSFLVNDAADVRLEDFERTDVLAITAGASAPETLVQAVLSRLRDHYDLSVETRAGIIETTTFKLPASVADLRVERSAAEA